MPSKAELEVEVFNLRNPVGTKVSYWTGAKEGDGRRGRTTYPAQIMSEGLCLTNATCLTKDKAAQ